MVLKATVGHNVYSAVSPAQCHKSLHIALINIINM